MKYGLGQSTIQQLQNVFSGYSTINKVIIYGSRAMGNFREGSDIDLAIEGSQIEANLLLNIRNKIDDLLLPYKVEITIYDQIKNDDLLEHIQRVGKLLYKKT